MNNSSVDTQKLIISAFLKQSALYPQVHKELSDEYFSDPKCKMIFKAIQRHYSKYLKMPTYRDTLVSLDLVYTDRYGIPIEDVKRECEELISGEDSDENVVRDTIQKFIVDYRIKRSFQDLVDKLKNNPNLEYTESIHKSLVDSLNIDLSTDDVQKITAESFINAKIDALGSDGVPETIRSFMPSINNSMVAGGWVRGTLDLLVGPPACLTGETKVMTRSGPMTLKDLESSGAENIEVYSKNLDTGEIELVTAKKCQITKYAYELIVLTLDDESVIRCTPDHKFLTTEGWKEAQELTIEDDLIPFDYENNHPVESEKDVYRFILSIERKKAKKIPVYDLIDCGRYHNFIVVTESDRFHKTGIVVHNSGKSMWLFMEGGHAAKQGFTVLHILIGDLTRFDGFARYLSVFSGLDQRTVLTMSRERIENTIRIVNQQYNNALDRCHVIAYPSYALKVEDLYNNITRIERMMGVDYDMIIVDYPDNLLRPTSSMYEEGGVIYGFLEKLAKTCKAVVLVASQPKIEYWDDEIIPLKGAAESSRKQHAVDTMLTINLHARDARFGTVFSPKSRRGIQGKRIRFKCDYDRCYIEEIDEGTYKELLDKYNEEHKMNVKKSD